MGSGRGEVWGRDWEKKLLLGWEKEINNKKTIILSLDIIRQYLVYFHLSIYFSISKTSDLKLLSFIWKKETDIHRDTEIHRLL